ncbi:MAG: hypothetical protein SynsKO_21340 [Synoicihabitans sp.]
MVRLAIGVLLLVSCAGFSSAAAGKFQRGEGLSQEEFTNVLKHCESQLPKIWSTLNLMREKGVNIRLSPERKMGPGKAAGTDRMVLSTFFLTKDLPKFPEDRLVVVILHEFGHLLFNRETKRNERNPVKHEFFAFAHSIKATMALAEAGYYGPLDQAIKNISIRAENGKPKDPHTIAIKQLIKTPLWAEAVAFLESS